MLFLRVNRQVQGLECRPSARPLGYIVMCENKDEQSEAV